MIFIWLTFSLYIILQVNIQMQSEAALKQAVQQQLDLILKIEEQRKLLKRENKLLKEEHQKMLNIVKKYNQQKRDVEVNTQQQEMEKVVQKLPEKPATREQFVQVDMDLHSNNVSKLTEAQELLKKQVVSQPSLCSRCEMGQILEPVQQQPRKKQSSNNQQISGEIVKMSKEIAALKRQLAQSQKNYKGRQKEIKQLKKCLQVKSEALQKSRKDFNELSNILNSDKYKSVRNLQNELAQTKAKLAVLQQQGRHSLTLRKALEDVTHQYEAYREDRESKIQRLTWQLKEKDSRCEELSRVMDTLRLENSFQ